MPLYLSASDLFIMPSLWEGACISIIEALACDVPVIATDVGNAKELINNENGIIIKPKNVKAIEDAIINSFNKKFKNMRNNAKTLYDWEVIAKNTMDVYKRLSRRYWNI